MSTKNAKTENSKDEFNALPNLFPNPAYRSMGSMDSGFQSKLYQQVKYRIPVLLNNLRPLTVKIARKPRSTEWGFDTF